MPIDPRLEAEYDNRARVPGHPAIFARWDARSAEFRAQRQTSGGAGIHLNLAYGLAERHRLDIVPADDARATLVFIHGGYWRSLDKSMFTFLAAPFAERRISTALVNYRLCPSVRIADIAADCAAALRWLAIHGESHGAPLTSVALAGHSAGAHLVALLLAASADESRALPFPVAAAAGLSGVYDLPPLRQCSMNADLRLDEREAASLSPARLEKAVATHLQLEVGERESAAFIDQSHALSQAWPDTSCQTVPGADHFTIVDHFVHGNSAARHALLNAMG